MELEGIGATAINTANNNAVDVPNNSELDRDDFLLLLTTQLANQNPLEPQEGAEFVAQLAQFSSLEQLTQLNGGMDAVASTQAALIQGQAVELVGKSGVFEGSFLDLPAEGDIPVVYDVTEPAQTVRIEVLAPNGQLVASFGGEASQGLQTTTFDGQGLDGDRLPPGRYTYRVVATGEDGAGVAVQRYATGKIDGVTYEGGLAELTSGDHRVTPADVVRVLD